MLRYNVRGCVRLESRAPQTFEKGMKTACLQIPPKRRRSFQRVDVNLLRVNRPVAQVVTAGSELAVHPAAYVSVSASALKARRCLKLFSDALFRQTQQPLVQIL